MTTSKARRQLFAIVRHDFLEPETTAIQNRITVTKVVDTEEVARAEVERLNQLGGSKGSLYFWQATRM
jgi:hypothetical protein